MEDTVQRVSAVDGLKLKMTPAIARLFRPHDFGWKKPVLGCALSHLRVWWQLANEKDDINSYLILEDDVCLAEGFIPKLSNALRYVPPNWDIVYIGCGAPEYMDERGGVPVKRIKSCEGTYGYIIRANTIPRIIQYFWLIGEPIDTTLNRLMKNLNVYTLVNPLITPDFEIESDIRSGK